MYSNTEMRWKGVERVNYSRLKMAIDEAGYTQKAFGEKIGFSKNGINYLLNGHRKMDIVVANLIVEALGITDSNILMEIFFLTQPKSELQIKKKEGIK